MKSTSKLIAKLGNEIQTLQNIVAAKSSHSHIAEQCDKLNDIYNKLWETDQKNA